jgi:conserved oligomeric Golgi complex subunit 6
MRKQIDDARRESAPMLEEASTLMAQKQEVEIKHRLLDAFNQHFLVSDEDLTVLTSSTEPVDDRFFQIMSHVKQIRKDCELLLANEGRNIGIELMEQTSRNLNAAFNKLYNWIQREFKALDFEDPHISRSIRRALRVLAEKPTLFQTCLDFFAEVRERALSDAFHAALTDTASGGPNTTRSTHPIELQTHDLPRYVGDMLAWVHSTTVSEKEALEGLFISDGDEIAKEIQAGRDSEPWSRTEHEDGEAGHSTPAFDGHKALNDLVNRDLEGVARMLRQRVEIAGKSNEDLLLVYRALNLFRFYKDIFSKLVGTPSILGTTVSELQTSTLTHFERLLQDETSAIAAESTPDDLSTPPFLLEALDQFKAFLETGADVSDPELSRLLSAALVPFLEQCSKMSRAVSEPTAQNIFQLNYLLAVDSALRPILPPNHGFLEAAHQKMDSLRGELVQTQHSFLLEQSGVGLLLDAIREAEAKGSNGADIASLPVFDAEALSTSAAQLDDFLPSALMDLLENMKQLTGRSLAKDVAHEAAERFCADFEQIEEAILRADEEARGSRRRAQDEGEEEEEEEEKEEEEVVILRDAYPRTTAEIRVLLS